MNKYKVQGSILTEDDIYGILEQPEHEGLDLDDFIELYGAELIAQSDETTQNNDLVPNQENNQNTNTQQDDQVNPNLEAALSSDTSWDYGNPEDLWYIPATKENKLKSYTEEWLNEHKPIFDAGVEGSRNNMIVKYWDAIENYKETGKFDVNLLPDNITEYDLPFDANNINTWVDKSDQQMYHPDDPNSYLRTMGWDKVMHIHDPSVWTDRLSITYGNNTEHIDLQPGFLGVGQDSGRKKAAEQFKKIQEWYNSQSAGDVNRQLIEANFDPLNLQEKNEFDIEAFNDFYTKNTGISVKRNDDERGKPIVDSNADGRGKRTTKYSVLKDGKVLKDFHLQEPTRGATYDDSFLDLKQYIKSITSDEDINKMLNTGGDIVKVHRREVLDPEKKKLEKSVTDQSIEWDFFAGDDERDNMSNYSKRFLYNLENNKWLKNKNIPEEDKQIIKDWLKNKRDTAYNIEYGPWTETMGIRSREKTKTNKKGKELTDHFTDLSDLNVSKETKDLLTNKIISGEGEDAIEYKNIVDLIIKTGFADRKQQEIDSKWIPISERLYNQRRILKVDDKEVLITPEILEVGGLWANVQADRKAQQIRDYVEDISLKNKWMKINLDLTSKRLTEIAERDNIGFTVEMVDDANDGVVDNILLHPIGMPEGYDAEDLKEAFSNLKNIILTQQADEHDQNIEFERRVNEWEELNNDYGSLQSVIFKEYDGGKILWNDWNSGWASLVYSVPALFGEENAIAKVNEIESRKRNFETMSKYGDAWANGEFGFHWARQVATQGANLTVAIGTFGFGMAPATARTLAGLRTTTGTRLSNLAIKNPGSYAALLKTEAGKQLYKEAMLKAGNQLSWTVAGSFGITSGGQKNATLTYSQQDAEMAKRYLEYMKKNQQLYTQEEYASLFADTQQAIALKDITTAEKALSVTGTGLTEMLFTRYIGTVPNALAASQAFKLGGRGSYMSATHPAVQAAQQANRGNWQAAAHAIGKTSLAIGGEVVEETGIEATVTTIDGLVLKAPYDYSHLDDVAITAILVSGPANGPSVTYSTIMQQAATKPWRDATKTLIDDYNSLKKQIKPKLTEQELLILHGKLENKEKEIIAVTEGLEADMIAVGEKGLKNLIKNNQSLKILYDAAKIRATDTETQIQEKIELYKRKLKASGRSDEAQEYQDRIDNLIDSNNRIMKNVNFTDMVSLRLGKMGEKIEEEFRTKSSKEYKGRKDKKAEKWKAADGPRAKFVEVLREMRSRLNEQTINEARTAKFIAPDAKEVSGQELVNLIMYDRMDGPRGRGRKRNIKRENELLLQFGRSNKRTEKEIEFDYQSALDFAKKIHGKNVKFDKQSSLEAFQKRWNEVYPDKAFDIKRFKQGLAQLTKNKDGKKLDPQDVRMISGFYDPATDTYVVNDIMMRQFGGDTYASSHELLHGILKSVLYGKGGEVSEEGQKIINDFKKRIGKENLKIVEKRLKDYGYAVDEKTGEYINQDEYVNQFYSAVRAGEIKLDEDIFANVASWTRNKLARKGAVVNIDDGQDLYNFIIDYKKGIEKGGIYTKRIIQLGKQSAASTVQGPAKKSLSDIGRVKESDAARKERLNELYEKNKGDWEYNLDARNGQLLNTILDAYNAKILSVIYGSKMLDTPTFRDEEGNVKEEQVNDALEETRFELIKHIRSFNRKFREGDENAVENNDFDAWVNSYIRDKFLSGVKRIKVEKWSGVSLDDALNVTEDVQSEWMADILYQSIVESGMFSETFVNEIKKEIAKILPTTKANIDQKVSKNRTVTPFISELKESLSTLIDGMIKGKMGGKVGGKFKTWLMANKQTIIENMTTTWLMGKDKKTHVEGGIPQAIEKSVGGKWVKVENAEGKMEDVFQPNWVPFPQWVGKKIDREKSSKTDRTDGKMLVRRVPFEQVDDKAYLGQFIKGDFTVDNRTYEEGKNKGKVIVDYEVNNSAKRLLSKQIAAELGFELFTEDLENNGPISEKWTMSEELKGRIVAENRVSEFRRQVDRGNAKMSGAIKPGTPLDWLQGQLLELIKQAVIHNSDTQLFESIKASYNPQVVYIAEALRLLDFHGQSVTNYKSPLKTWEELPSAFKEAMLAYQKTKTEGEEESGKAMAAFSNELMDNLDPELVALLPMEFFGLISRGLNPSEKHWADQGKVMPQHIKDLKDKYQKIKKAHEKTAEKGKWKNVRIYNSKYGLMGRINTILYKDFKTAAAKRKEVKKLYGTEIENANIANHEALEVILQTFIDIASVNPNMAEGMMRLFQNSAVKGLRGLTILKSIQYTAQSQAPMVRIDQEGNRVGVATKTKLKNGKLDPRYTYEVNKNHINYKDAVKEGKRLVKEGKIKPKKLKDGKVTNEWIMVKLGQKGEHVKPSANEFLAWTKYILKQANEIRKLPNHGKKPPLKEDQNYYEGQKAQILAQSALEIKALIAGYEQTLGAEINSAIQDRKKFGGKTSKAGQFRGLVLTKKALNSFYTLDGVQAINYIGRNLPTVETVNEVLGDLNFELQIEQNTILKARDKAKMSRSSKGISVFDFDDTLAFTGSKIVVTMPNNLWKQKQLEKEGKKKVVKSSKAWTGGDKQAFEDQMGYVPASRDWLAQMALDKGKPSWWYKLSVKENRERFRRIKDLETQYSADELRNKIKKAKGKTKTDLILALEEKFEKFPELVQDSGIDIYTGKPIKKLELTPAEFAERHAELESMGATFDFSQFNKVIDGKKGPLADLALKRQGKFGSGDIYVLTARPQTSAKPIHIFLKGIGLNIPLENITGLENGTAKAKADWIMKKVAEGYNNFYFADDAIQNVKEVKRVLDMLPDVKSEVELAKFSKSGENARSKKFNEILEQTKGEKAWKKYSEVTARRKGGKKGRYQFYLPPNAEDFMGLIYAFLGRGKLGEEQKKWFVENLIDPYARGISALNDAQQNIKRDYETLLKKFPGMRSKLEKTIPSGDYTYDQAIRVYIWTNAGMGIPGISKTDSARIMNDIGKDADAKNFAAALTVIINNNGMYPEPSQYWDSQSILSDIASMTFKIGRKQFLKEFIQAKDEIFTKENLNKIEALYGTNFREALEDILWRMENGTNRKQGGARVVRIFNEWVNRSVGAVMFFNMKSATLQTISFVNFINWSDNNVLAASLAFANQPQFWKDFAMIMNSNKLKQRRSGLQINVQEAELANAAREGKGDPNAILSYLLKKGFLPTQIADSFAIALGGATFYRNRVNTYIKQGFDKKTAEEKAWFDFSKIADETQQSSDPMLISSIQASELGRFLFAWQNTPFQYNRLMKKAALDLINNRGDHKTNISKILYYGAIQNFIFSAMQNALFAVLPGFEGDEEDDEAKEAEKLLQKKIRIANNMLDTILRGSGLPGAIVSTIKNIVMEYSDQEKKGWNADHTYTLIEAFNLSPTIGSKARKFYSGIQTERFEKDVIAAKGWAYDSPRWQSVGSFTAAATNIPLDRVVLKMHNVIGALDDRNEAWQRIAMAMGWPGWNVGVEVFPEHDIIKDQARERRKKEGIEKAKRTRAITKEIKDGIMDKIWNSTVKTQEWFKMSKEQQKEWLNNEVEKIKKERNL